MSLFNISDLIWDETIYPRSARKQQTIDAYSEVLTAGAQFPPIIIQPVVNYPAPIPDRPEIEPFHWTADTTTWPCAREPDLIFFDPPYFTKKKKAYQEKADPQTPPISSLPRHQYMQFFTRFFELAHENTHPGAILAFLNADWRDFESTPAKQESPDHAITLFDFHGLLSETGWKLTHRIEYPLSSERLSDTQVKKMQDKRILGTVSRNLLIAKHISGGSHHRYPPAVPACGNSENAGRRRQNPDTAVVNSMEKYLPIIYVRGYAGSQGALVLRVRDKRGGSA
jgi:hypothetical protein